MRLNLDLDFPDDREIPRDRDVERSRGAVHGPSEIPLPPPDVLSVHRERHQVISGRNHFPNIPRRPREMKQKQMERVESPAVERHSRSDRSPRHELGVGIHVRPEEMKVMTEVGRFRVITVRDLADTIYHGDRRSLDSDLNYLRGKGLVSLDSINARRDGRWTNVERIEIVTLTNSGKKLVRQSGEMPSDQHIYAGLVKPREAQHDAQIYRAYLKEVEKIEQRGGSNPRVKLDFEIKSGVQRAIHAERKADPERPLDEIKQQVAQQFDLPCVDNQIQIPDARIEYELGQGSKSEFSDIEVVTGAYRPGHLRSKAQAGFQLYASSADRARLGRDIEDEHHILHEIMNL